MNWRTRWIDKPGELTNPVNWRTRWIDKPGEFTNLVNWWTWWMTNPVNWRTRWIDKPGECKCEPGDLMNPVNWQTRWIDKPGELTNPVNWRTRWIDEPGELTNPVNWWTRWIDEPGELTNPVNNWWTRLIDKEPSELMNLVNWRIPYINKPDELVKIWCIDSSSYEPDSSKDYLQSLDVPLFFEFKSAHCRKQRPLHTTRDRLLWIAGPCFSITGAHFRIRPLMPIADDDDDDDDARTTPCINTCRRRGPSYFTYKTCVVCCSRCAPGFRSASHLNFLINISWFTVVHDRTHTPRQHNIRQKYVADTQYVVCVMYICTHTTT